MAWFVISKHDNGTYKFDYYSRKGKPLLSSIGCKQKSDCLLIKESLQNHFDAFMITRKRTLSGKHFFRLSRNGLVLAGSRNFSTPLRLDKIIEEIRASMKDAETFDFSENEVIFTD